ncbi:hypothetical protein LTR70_003576 [Exophiala xenobiotica]|uniref:Heterokaryon incompatibility domain-containing protein n=1 Tax=Lithohypha guttulata TaxID=1690604 RepID=A0ABR0KHZ3_9EURO|nr:hypothetical protein LTR24_003124 [Lithohypha guttulata]KAK5322955.1 hypothetical protein LTR70_003576 [Exophiala xenobiotica]
MKHPWTGKIQTLLFVSVDAGLWVGGFEGSDLAQALYGRDKCPNSGLARRVASLHDQGLRAAASVPMLPSFTGHNTWHNLSAEDLPSCISGHVQCELRNGDLKTSSYRALSYVLRSPRDTYLIELEWKEWHVRKSLFTFLSKAQIEFTDQLLWVDALCIDQSNVQERNRQVQQMCKLYSKANQVLVWLENALGAPGFFFYFSQSGEWIGSAGHLEVRDEAGDEEQES